MTFGPSNEPNEYARQRWSSTERPFIECVSDACSDRIVR